MPLLDAQRKSVQEALQKSLQNAVIFGSSIAATAKDTNFARGFRVWVGLKAGHMSFFWGEPLSGLFSEEAKRQLQIVGGFPLLIQRGRPGGYGFQILCFSIKNRPLLIRGFEGRQRGVPKFETYPCEFVSKYKIPYRVGQVCLFIL